MPRTNSQMGYAAKLACNLMDGDFVAVTLSGGYAVRRDGSRYLFTPCRVRVAKRNASGRCTKLIGTYYDGSTIQFTWSEAHGYRYKATDSAVDGSSVHPDNED